MQYLLTLVLGVFVVSVLLVAALLRWGIRAHLQQSRALAATVEGASEKLASRIARIADRTERVEKVLLELLERADAAMSTNGIDLKAHRGAMRESAIDRMRDLLSKGDEASAIKVWRDTTGIGVRGAVAMVENLEREMSQPPPARNGAGDRAAPAPAGGAPAP